VGRLYKSQTCAAGPSPVQSCTYVHRARLLFARNEENDLAWRCSCKARGRHPVCRFWQHCRWSGRGDGWKYQAEVDEMCMHRAQTLRVDRSGVSKLHRCRHRGLLPGRRLRCPCFYVHASAGADPAADTVATHRLCEWHQIPTDKKHRLSCDMYQEQQRLTLVARRRHQSGGVAGGEADAMGGTGGAVGASARRGARDGARAARRGGFTS